MAKPPDAVGDAVEAGTLIRLIPNWTSHWNYGQGRPEARAFRKDGDVGVSMLLKERIGLDEIFRRKPQLSPFGACELLVDDLVAEENVWVKVDPNEDFYDAHVLVIGITKRRIDWLRELGCRRILKLPAPAKEPWSDVDLTGPR